MKNPFPLIGLGLAGLAISVGATQIVTADSPSGGIQIVSESQRVLDTRNGSDPQANLLDIAPYWSTAAIVNVGIIGTTGPGYATVYDCYDVPEVSHLTWSEAGAYVSNMVAVPMSVDRSICVYTSSPANVVVDTVGWSQTELFEVVP